MARREVAVSTTLGFGGRGRENPRTSGSSVISRLGRMTVNAGVNRVQSTSAAATKSSSWSSAAATRASRARAGSAGHRGAASVRPRPPRPCRRRPTVPTPRTRQGSRQRAAAARGRRGRRCRGIAAVPADAPHPGDRREVHDRVQAFPVEQLVEVAGAGDLGADQRRRGRRCRCAPAVPACWRPRCAGPRSPGPLGESTQRPPRRGRRRRTRRCDPRAELRPVPRSSSPAPGAVVPRLLTSTRCSAPFAASQRATCPPIAPVPPVTRTVPRGRHDRAGSRSGARTSLRANTPDGRTASWSSPSVRASTAASRAVARSSTTSGRSTSPPQCRGCSSAATRPSPHTCACSGHVGASASVAPTAPWVTHHSGAPGSASSAACSKDSVAARPAGVPRGARGAGLCRGRARTGSLSSHRHPGVPPVRRHRWWPGRRPRSRPRPAARAVPRCRSGDRLGGRRGEDEPAPGEHRRHRFGDGPPPNHVSPGVHTGLFAYRAVPRRQRGQHRLDGVGGQRQGVGEDAGVPGRDGGPEPAFSRTEPVAGGRPGRGARPEPLALERVRGQVHPAAVGERGVQSTGRPRTWASARLVSKRRGPASSRRSVPRTSAAEPAVSWIAAVSTGCGLTSTKIAVALAQQRLGGLVEPHGPAQVRYQYSASSVVVSRGSPVTAE